MTPFTVPITIDAFKLWIPQPKVGKDSFVDNTRKLLKPFSTGLWIAIIAITIAFAVMSAFISPRDYQQESDREKRRGRDKRTSRRDSILQSKSFKKSKELVAELAAKKVANAITGSFLDLLGGSVSYNVESSAAQKFINFGFAVFVFVVVTAYTANLTAFLTLSGTSKYLSSMEEALSNNLPLCAPIGVKGDLTDLYPDANWVFGGTSAELVKLYDEGKCHAIVQGWVDVRGNAYEHQLFCDRNLVRVGVPIMEKAIAFPARKEYVAGISHWLAVAQKQGITFDNFLLSSEARCNLEIVLNNNVSNQLQQITLANMALPFFCIWPVFHFCHCPTSTQKVHGEEITSFSKGNVFSKQANDITA